MLHGSIYCCNLFRLATANIFLVLREIKRLSPSSEISMVLLQPPHLKLQNCKIVKLQKWYSVVCLGPCQISIEAAVCNCSSKQGFLKISQYSQETPTTLCPQNVTNAKKQYALNFVCSSYKIRLPWHISLLRIKN